jgi:hypothetical protein
LEAADGYATTRDLGGSRRTLQDSEVPEADSDNVAADREETTEGAERDFIHTELNSRDGRDDSSLSRGAGDL